MGSQTSRRIGRMGAAPPSTARFMGRSKVAPFGLGAIFVMCCAFVITTAYCARPICTRDNLRVGLVVPPTNIQLPPYDGHMDQRSKVNGWRRSSFLYTTSDRCRRVGHNASSRTGLPHLGQTCATSCRACACFFPRKSSLRRRRSPLSCQVRSIRLRTPVRHVNTPPTSRQANTLNRRRADSHRHGSQRHGQRGGALRPCARSRDLGLTRRQ